jgi:hypothetical protein
LAPGTYYWRAQNQDQSGVKSAFSDVWSFTMIGPPTATYTPTPIATATPAPPPSANAVYPRNTLVQNGKPCRIYFDLNEARKVDLKIYTLNGEYLCTLIGGVEYPAGTYWTDWYGKNFADAPVASGIYLVEFKAGNFKKVFKIAVIH